MSFPVPQNINDYVRLLEDGTPFTYANIGGDGEFLTIVGWDGTNSDGRTSTPEKAEALGRVLLQPRLTLHGYNPGKAESQKLAEAEAWLRWHGINVPDRGATTLVDPDYGSARINVRWVHKEIIASANVNGRLNGFIRALRARPLYVIASADVTESFCLDTLNADAMLLLSKDDGWECMDDMESMVRARLDTLPSDTIVSWSLGYLTKVLMWRLAPDYPDMTQVDMGACWDPYCGVRNRHGYKRNTWPAAMTANLEGL